MEIWRQINENPKYEISSYGNVRNAEFKNALKIKQTSIGSRVKIQDVEYHVRDLVTSAFLPNKFNSKYIIHKDNDKNNNNVNNLQWSYTKNKIVKTEIIRPYTISYEKYDGYHVYFPETEEIKIMDRMPQDRNNFKMLNVNNNKATDNDLLEYAKSFKQWNDELKNNGIYSIEYDTCCNDYLAVTRTFNRFCKRFYNLHDSISPIEYKYYEKCRNSGLVYIKDNDFEIICYSYDYKNQYPTIMNSDYRIPTKQGQETTLDELPKLSKDVKAGIYHVKITSDNENFKKIFGFSKDDHYLDLSLKFAMKNRKKFNVNIELVKHENNALIYRDEDMVTLKSITDEWFNKLTAIRKMYPKNRLIKHLLSSAWGHLNAHNTITRTLEEAQKEGLNFGRRDMYDYKIINIEPHDNNKDVYELLNTKSPYKHNIRLKPWITAISRIMTAELALMDIDNVVRVMVDCVSFTKPIEMTNENIVEEDKTTGLIFWRDAGCYHNITTGYKSKNFD